MTLQQLFELRNQGKRLADFVLLTLVPQLAKKISCIPVDGSEYRGLFGLHVVLAFTTRQKGMAIQIADRISAVGVQFLELWVLDSGKWISVVEFGEKHIAENPPLLPDLSLHIRGLFRARNQRHG